MTSALVPPAVGPLQGCRVVEVGGIGPGPFVGMVLADLGAEVIRVDRADGGGIDYDTHRYLLRGRKSLAVDLKDERGRAVVEAIAARADILIEGFRPGVMERLGLGPDDLLARNPRLVYGRMTGWGQEGPLAPFAGHDINYIAIAGALLPVMADNGKPTPPLNMLGDFGGGAMLMLSGVLAALTHARTTGQGQVVDAAIVDGTALMTAMLHSMRATGQWVDSARSNLLDGGAPYYDVYQTSDGGWLALGSLEPAFYARLINGLGLATDLAEVEQFDRRTWPRMRELFAETIARKTRDEWARVFRDLDACVSPVLSPDEAARHPHLEARRTYDHSQGLQPSPAPRFSQTPLVLPPPAPVLGEHGAEVLRENGFPEQEILDLVRGGIVRSSSEAVA